MDAIGLIKLFRKAAQPSRISVVWPHIQQLAILPAKDDQTTRTLIGSVISCTLEAKDSETAASVWSYLRSSPHLQLQEAVATQLLLALRGRPELVVELITALQNDKLANAQHFAAALQSLALHPDHCKHVFELAMRHKKVNGVTLVVWCQVQQQHQNLEGALNTLSTADSLGITPQPAHYTVLLSCAARLKDVAATRLIHKHLSQQSHAKNNGIILGALFQTYAECKDFDSAGVVLTVHVWFVPAWCEQKHDNTAGRK